MELYEEATLTPEVETMDEVAEATKGRKVLRIVIEVEVGGTKNHSGRLKEAYLMAVSSAGEAIREVMMNGSVVKLSSEMTYEYRHMEGAFIDWRVNGNGG